ncbi:MAG: efflux RND transporter periplasmic adaptor subunit [Sandaracinaceae bacterium]|nr:efflux RND transporter periplasmic adaptor subunit [Sandaracinaceae bacterium]
MRASSLTVLVLAALGQLTSACGGGDAEPDAALAQEPEAPPLRHEGSRIVIPEGSPLRERIRVEAIAPTDVQRSLIVPAHVEADPSHLARICPPLAGRVVRLHVALGQEVRPGDPLLDLDSPELVAAQTDALNAHAALAQAERNLTRQEDLAEHGIAPRADLEQAQTAEQLARQEVQRAQMRLRLLGVGGGRVGRTLTVRSPIAGRVVELHVAAGEYHNDPAVPVMVVADLSVVWITASVQERDLSRVTMGMRAVAELAAYPGQPVEGHVFHLGALLDPDTRTLPVRISLENPDGHLHPGMFARVTFEETARPELVVPAPAIVLRGDSNVVFVESTPWTFEPRVITLGEPAGNASVVATGLASGDRVVVANAVLLQ